MTHETFREMLPLYVIGALDGDELYHFERYIAENREICQAEMAEYQAIADQMVLAVPYAQPSPTVYNRILTAIEEKKRPVETPAPAPIPAPAPVAPPTRVPIRVPVAAPVSIPAPAAAHGPGTRANCQTPRARRFQFRLAHSPRSAVGGDCRAGGSVVQRKRPTSSDDAPASVDNGFL